MSFLRKLRRLDRVEMLLLLEAGLLVTLAMLMLRIRPFASIARQLGMPGADSFDGRLTEAESRTVGRIATAIRRTGKYHPLRPKCLQEALAGRWMLRRRGFACTLYIGVFRDDRLALSAHAWLRAGHILVTGGPVSPSFAQIQKFS